MIYDGERYIVYYDGMTDVLTAEQFASSDHYTAFAGPFRSHEQLEAAATYLRVLPNGEAQPSPGWQRATKKHRFVPSDDPRYCAAVVDETLERPIRCHHHARYHGDAPQALRATTANPRRFPTVHSELFLEHSDALDWAHFENADEPAPDAISWKVVPIAVPGLQNYVGDTPLIPEGATPGGPRRLTTDDVNAIARAATTASPATAAYACARATAINRGITVVDEPVIERLDATFGARASAIQTMTDAIFAERYPGMSLEPEGAPIYRAAAEAALRALRVIE